MNFKVPNSIELIEAFQDNPTESIKSFETVINLNATYRRQCLINDIDPDVGETVEAYIRFFNDMDNDLDIPIEKRQPIYLFIDSYGGDINACFTIIDAIKMSKTPIYTINMGTAYSAGFFIAIAGHKRFAYPHSSYLYHEGSAGTQGTASQFENFASFYKKQLGMLRKHTLQNTKISEEKYEEIKKDDFWMTADEALELGVVDEITHTLEIK